MLNESQRNWLPIVIKITEENMRTIESRRECSVETALLDLIDHRIPQPARIMRELGSGAWPREEGSAKQRWREVEQRMIGCRLMGAIKATSKPEP